MPPVPLRRRLLLAVPPALRGAALTPAAALLVHQARYELAYGVDAPRALAEQGHAYLSSTAPWIVLLAALALGASLGALVQRWAGGAGTDGRAPRVSAVRVWLLASAGLLAIFTGQELLEGWLAPGHAAGAAAVLGAGGWWALPAALVVGGLLTLVLRAGTVVQEALAALAPLQLRLRAGARAVTGTLLASAAPRRSRPLARCAAGRAPPGDRAIPALLA